MTEAGAISMCLAFAKEPYEIKSGSCGTVVRNAELKIIDPNTGASLRRNESGEICVRGPQIMKGNSHVSSGKLMDPPCSNACFHTFELYTGKDVSVHTLKTRNSYYRTVNY